MDRYTSTIFMTSIGCNLAVLPGSGAGGAGSVGRKRGYGAMEASVRSVSVFVYSGYAVPFPDHIYRYL